MRLRLELAARRRRRARAAAGRRAARCSRAAVGEAPARVDVRKALDKVANDPNLAPERTVNMLRWKEPEPVTDEPWWWQWANAAARWFRGFFGWIAESGRLLVWVLGALRAALLAIFIVRLVRARGLPRVPKRVRGAEPRARSRHSAGEPARRRRRRCARALAARRAARGARVAVSRLVVAPRARARRADSRVVDGRRVPRARSAAARGAERALRVASRRDLGRGRLRRARARRLRGAGSVRRVRRGTRPRRAAHETTERA